ncbi:ABC transporter permease subunit [Roseomonas sp. CCTCC AB2023176]|uniref:ABC transporter permease subunit n=1 Tax=Roseomonas sp. CCTCC AB2023176 TaxID=3342640 RepID=UPI0035D54DD0
MLAFGAGVAPLALGWIAVAPNRLLSARAVALPADPGVMAAAGAFLISCALVAFAALRPLRPSIAEGAAAVGIGALVLAAGLGAGHATADAGALARASPTAGAWGAVLLLCLAATMAAGRSGASPARPLLVALAGVVVIGAGGWLSALSLAREAQGRAGEVAAAVVTHLAISGGALALALLVALPLSLRALWRPRLEGSLLGAATAVQVVPSLALFGLLIAPLAALANAVPALRAIGFGGIGPAPAVIGIAAYLVLPLARGTLSGLRAAPAPLLDAARGQGLSERQVLLRVRMPLGAPVLRARCGWRRCRRSGWRRWPRWSGRAGSGRSSSRGSGNWRGT